MLEKVKNNLSLLLAIVAIVFACLFLKQCNNTKTAKQGAKDFDKAIAALNDSLKKVVNSKGDTVWQEKVVSFDLKDIMNSETYKSLDKANQAYIKKLRDTKGLLAQAEYQLAAKDSIISSLGYKDTVNVSKDLICYKKGHVLSIAKSKGNLSFVHNIGFKESIESELEYTYRINIETTFKKDKKGMMLVEHKTNDPNAAFSSGHSYLTPLPEKTWWEKNDQYITGGLGLVGGFFIGSRTK